MRKEARIVGQPFPEIKSLAGRVVTLPEAVRGKVALICVAFMRSTQSMIYSWTQPFEQKFGKDDRFAVYEVPMISAGWKVFSWMIDSGRGGYRQRNVITLSLSVGIKQDFK